MTNPYFQTLEPLWQYLIDYNIATENELILITKINGLNLQTLQDILYTRTGHRNFAQHIEEHTPEALHEIPSLT